MTLNFDFNKLQSLVDDWAIRFDHIAEITFFQNTKPNRPYGIDLVLCDPPRISPKWEAPLTIKDGFFEYGGKMLTEEIVQNAYPEVPPAFINHPKGTICDYKDQASKLKSYADQWVFIIRWETDRIYLPDIIHESKKNLFSAPKVQRMEDMFKKFSVEDYEHFARLLFFTEDECLDLLIGYPFSTKKAVYNPKVRLDKDFWKFKKGAAIKWEKEFNQLIEKNKEIFNQAIESGELDLWARSKGLTVDADQFLKWAKNRGYIIPIGKISSPIEIQHDNQGNISSQTLPLQPEPQVRTNEILDSGTTDYERLKIEFREDPTVIINKRDENLERTIWDRYIKPIVDLHFHSAYQYQFFSEPSIITQGHLNSVWGTLLQHCYNYDGYNPENFKTDVMDRLRAGMPDDEKGVALEKLKAIFYSFLKSLIEDKTLPLFLMYLYYEGGAKLSIASSPNIKRDQFTIPVPDGTQWGQIKFRYVNDSIVQISYPGGNQPFSSTSLGLADKPMLFELFKLFAKSKGTLPPAHAPEQIKANVSNLRKHLKSLFPGISGLPIKEYTKREGWRCNFQIDCYEVDSDSEPQKILGLEEILSESQKIPTKSKPKYNTHE